MKNNKLFLSLFLFIILLLTGCGYAGPEKAVKQELSLIQQLDESTIKHFITYENILFANPPPAEVGPDAAEAVKLFFKNFQYKIKSSSVNSDGSHAEVIVTIKNLDARQLARDLCLKMIANSVSEPDNDASPSAFTLMKEWLETNTYPIVKTEAAFHLRKQDDLWLIEESALLEDELVGGLVSYLNDPYLLTPEEVLDATLSPTKDFDAAKWLTYLELNDIFNTGSTLAPEIDQILSQKIAENYSYEILGSTQDGDTAYVELKLTSLDLAHVMDGCHKELLNYAQTTESIRATDEELTENTASILLKNLQACETSVEHILTVNLVNNNYTWEVHMNDIFADALLGGINTALETLTASE